jgi:excisionase family DNA binding protein
MMTDAGRARAEKRFLQQQDAARRSGLLTVDEVCQRLRCSRTKFYASIRDAKTFPRPVVIGARYHYVSDEVDAWYYSQRV